MEKEFDFNRIGKRMPYTTPEGFFNKMEADIWERSQHESLKPARRETSRLRAVLIGTAAVAASITLLLLLNPFSSGQADGFSKVEQAFAGLSQEDQDYMLEVYQEDIFINR